MSEEGCETGGLRIPARPGPIAVSEHVRALQRSRARSTREAVMYTEALDAGAAECGG